MFYFYLLVFIISVIALGVSSGMVARSFIKLARVVGLNEYLTAFILFGAATSIPELFIALTSVISGAPMISIGNTIGANFANITLVLGLTAYLSGNLEISRQVSKRVYWLSLLLALLPVILIINGGISQLSGLLLCVIFIAYMVLFSLDERFIERSTQHVPYGIHYFSEVYPNLINFVLGLIILIFSSIFIIIFTSNLTGYLSVDLVLFSTVFLGLVTTLPELFFGMRGALLRHPSLSLGNILASVVFNSTVIIGLVTLVSPVAGVFAFGGLLKLICALTVIAFILLSVFSFRSSRINRLEGVLLMSLYALFLISAFLFF